MSSDVNLLRELRRRIDMQRAQLARRPRQRPWSDTPEAGSEDAERWRVHHQRDDVDEDVERAEAARIHRRDERRPVAANPSGGLSREQRIRLALRRQRR